MLVARNAAQRPGGVLGKCSDGFNILQHAVNIDDADTVRLAIARGVSPVMEESHHILCYAVISESMRAARVLLRLPLVRESAEKELAVVALLAVRKGNMEMVELLLDNFGPAIFRPCAPLKYCGFGLFVVAVALQRCSLGILRRLKALGRTPGVLSVLDAVDPTWTWSTPYVRHEVAKMLGREDEETDPDNAKFMEAWIAEDKGESRKRLLAARDLIEGPPKKLRRSERIRKLRAAVN